MTIVESVKKGFTEAGKLMNVILIFFAFNVIVGLVSMPLTNPDKAGNPVFIAVSVVASILFFIVFIFLQGGALGVVRDEIKTGAFSVANFVNYGKGYYVRIFLLLLIYLIVAIGVVLILSLISAGILLLGDNALTRGIVAVIVSLSAIAIITLLIYPIYAVVADDIGPFDAFKKGVITARTNFIRTLGLFFTMLLISLTISLVIGFLVGIVSVPLGQDLSRVIVTIVNAGIQSYIPIVMMVAFMSFYMGIREN